MPAAHQGKPPEMGFQFNRDALNQSIPSNNGIASFRMVFPISVKRQDSWIQRQAGIHKRARPVKLFLT